MAQRLVRAPQDRAILELARDLGVSERRLLGWEPREFHEYVYDDAGRVAQVIVTREPEWDHLQRFRMLALAQYEADVHAEGCGLHDSIAREDPHIRLEDEVCPICAELEAAMRKRAHLEHEEEKDYAAGQRRAGDGRTTRIRLLTPEEVAKLPQTPASVATDPGTTQRSRAHQRSAGSRRASRT